MKLELSEAHWRVLYDLVASRIRELHPEIRRTRVRSYAEELREELRLLEELQRQMDASRCDAPA